MIWLFILACIPLLTIWRGYVLSVLWLWFVVPLGAPALSIPAAIGVSLVVGMFTMGSRVKSDGTDKSTATDALATQIAYFIVAGIALLMGWVVQGFL